jgi:hypothetical protein
MSEVRKFSVTLTDGETGTLSRVSVAADGERVLLRIGAARWLLSTADASALANALASGPLDEAKRQIARVDELCDRLKERGYSIESLDRALCDSRNSIQGRLVAAFLAVQTPPENTLPEEEKEARHD